MGASVSYQKVHTIPGDRVSKSTTYVAGVMIKFTVLPFISSSVTNSIQPSARRFPILAGTMSTIVPVTPSKRFLLTGILPPKLKSIFVSLLSAIYLFQLYDMPASVNCAGRHFFHISGYAGADNP